MKHGLRAGFVPLRDAPKEVARLTALLAGEWADDDRWRIGTMAAEAHLELLRIEDAKRALVNRELAAHKFWEAEPVLAIIAAARILKQVRRYETRARWRRSRAFELL